MIESDIYCKNLCLSKKKEDKIMLNFFRKENACAHEEVQQELKDDEVIVNISYECIGKDINGKNINRIVYDNPPLNYQLIQIIEDKKTAILRDLDYAVHD